MRLSEARQTVQLGSEVRVVMLGLGWRDKNPEQDVKELNSTRETLGSWGSFVKKITELGREPTSLPSRNNHLASEKADLW